MENLNNIKEIRINNNCLEIIFEDRYITFSLENIKSIDDFINELNLSKKSLIQLGKNKDAK